MSKNKMNKEINITLPITSTVILLFILKMANVIEIPWIWVFAPFWIPITLFFIVIAAVIAIELITISIDSFIKKNNK